MGFWNGISSFFSNVGSSSSQSNTEDNPEYKKYAAEISNFKLEEKDVKTPSSAKNQDFQLNQIQDTLDDIDSLDDVKKHFQDK